MAAALPTIDEILAGVAGSTYTVQQARLWIDAHMVAHRRDEFAGLAMQTLMADRKFVQDRVNLGQDGCAAVAVASYLQADAMETARNS